MVNRYVGDESECDVGLWCTTLSMNRSLSTSGLSPSHFKAVFIPLLKKPILDPSDGKIDLYRTLCLVNVA